MLDNRYEQRVYDCGCFYEARLRGDEADFIRMCVCDTCSELSLEHITRYVDELDSQGVLTLDLPSSQRATGGERK